jgi:uncharacterized membrane protein
MKKFIDLNAFLLPERAFLVISLVFGFFYLIITPPLQVPDEPNHFYRAYQVSEGTFLAEKSDKRVGGLLPSSLLSFKALYEPVIADAKMTRALRVQGFDLSLNSAHREFIDFNNTALYSPVCYLPQAAGILLGRLFNGSVLTLFYLARILPLLCWILMVFYAIKIIPVAKWLFCFAALLPMSVYINATVSADVMTNAMAFLFIAVCLNTALRPQTLSSRRIILLITILVLIPLVKTIYVSLVPLIFVIPRQKFGSGLKQVTMISVFILSAAITLLIWSKAVKGMYLSYDDYNPAYRDKVALFGGADANRQLAHILRHNVVFYRVVGNSTVSLFKNYLPNYIASFGWADLNPPKWFSYTLLICLFLIAIVESENGREFKVLMRFFVFISFFASLVAVIFTQYLIWTGPGPEVVNLTQARYLIPFFPLLVLCFYAIIPRPHFKWSVAIPVICTGSLLYCSVLIVCRYY